MKLIVGLGNPGEKYDLTKHNVGYIVLDELARLNDLTFKYEAKFEAFVSMATINGNKAIIAKPTTYVNLSGNAVSKIMNYYNIELEDLLVIFDDIHLDPGTIRIREVGGHGGHNGVRNIIDHVKTKRFKRIKIGIGNNTKVELNHHVLSRFSKSEMNKLEPSFNAAVDASERFIKGDYFKDIMTFHNTQT